MDNTEAINEWYGRLAKMGGAFDACRASATATVATSWRDLAVGRVIGPALILAATIENAAQFPDWLEDLRKRIALPEDAPEDIRVIFSEVMDDVRALLAWRVGDPIP